MTVRVAVDANGADLGPAEVAAGAALAVSRVPDLHVTLFGPAAELGDAVDRVTVVDAPVSIAKDPEPALAVRRERDASIVLAAKAVGAGEADALVSGGSTGAALAAAVTSVRRGRGVYRPALAVPLPLPSGPVTMVDVGANTEVRVEQLVQFAFMGAALASAVLGVDRPRVALLSNGEEPTKGTPLVVETHAALAALPSLRFVGNIEGVAITQGAADVVVTDGFTGNVALKTVEGTSRTVLDMVRAAATSNLLGMAGGLLLKPALGGLRARIDPEQVGGAYLLGLRRLGVVPHGRFSREGFARAIELAARGVTEDVVGRTHIALDAAGALRRAASDPPTSVSTP